LTIELQTIGILMPGDMGHACGAVLKKNGFRVITALNGRTHRTKSLATEAAIDDVGDLRAVVKQSDLILSILPPQHAYNLAKKVSTIMRDISRYPDFVDCNAISPATVNNIAQQFNNMPTRFIDGSIIGLNPIKENEQTRLYVSGDKLDLISQIDGRGLVVKAVGSEIGQASSLKMLYAGATKGAFSLFAAVGLMAELAGLKEELFSEFEFSKPDVLKSINYMIPRIPVDAARWIPEMEEISATYKQYGMTAKFHEGAKELMEIALNTPLSAETRETLPNDFDINEALEMYKDAFLDLKSR